MPNLDILLSYVLQITHLVTHLVWPHGGPVSMRPRALRAMQNPLKKPILVFLILSSLLPALERVDYTVSLFYAVLSGVSEKVRLSR